MGQDFLDRQYNGYDPMGENVNYNTGGKEMISGGYCISKKF